MIIPWHASQSDIAFLRCGAWASNHGNGAHYFKSNRNHSLYRSWHCWSHDKLNRLAMWTKLSGLDLLVWGHRCDDCENE